MRSPMMKMLNKDTALVTVGQVAAKRALRDKKVSQRDESLYRSDHWYGVTPIYILCI